MPHFNKVTFFVASLLEVTKKFVALECILHFENIN